MRSDGRIAFDASPLCRNISGVGRYTYNLITAYADAHPNTDIYLLCFINDKIHSEYMLPQKNIRIHRLPIPRRIYQLTYRKFFRIPCDIWVKKLSLDAVVCSNFVMFPYIKSTPSIVIVHDTAFMRHPQTIEPKNLAYLSKHVPISLKESWRTAAVSEFTRSEISSLFDKTSKPVALISAGINPDEHRSVERKRFLLAVATLEPRKNLAKLLEAYGLLPEALRERYPLKIVGAKGWGNDPLHEVPRHAELLGYVSDNELEDLYASCSYLVFPSTYEGFGLPILEAFSHNTPVICSDIPPFREIAGDNALYFNPADSRDIAKKIALALSGRHKTPTDYKDILRHWGWQKSAKQLTKLIHSL